MCHITDDTGNWEDLNGLEEEDTVTETMKESGLDGWETDLFNKLEQAEEGSVKQKVRISLPYFKEDKSFTCHLSTNTTAKVMG